MKTKYRIKVEYWYNGEYRYIPQRRILFIWFSYKEYLGMDGVPSVKSFGSEKEAMKIVNKWMTDKVFPKVKYINL